ATAALRHSIAALRRGADVGGVPTALRHRGARRPARVGRAGAARPGAAGRGGAVADGGGGRAFRHARPLAVLRGGAGLDGGLRMALNLSILYRGPLSSCNYGCAYCPFAKHAETAEELAADRRALERFTGWVSRRGG